MEGLGGEGEGRRGGVGSSWQRGRGGGGGEGGDGGVRLSGVVKNPAREGPRRQPELLRNDLAHSNPAKKGFRAYQPSPGRRLRGR